MSDGTLGLMLANRGLPEVGEPAGSGGEAVLTLLRPAGSRR
jgi:hypothetical protein